jgi:hypothetical protein
LLFYEALHSFGKTFLTQNPNLTMPETTNTVDCTTYRIPLEDAERYTKRWREAHPSSDRAFTINVEELKDIVNELGKRHQDYIPQIRVYFGIKDDGKEALILVGVDKWGKDITVLPIPPGATSSGADAADDSGTYDFTRPCPGTCDTTSSLNGN